MDDVRAVMDAAGSTRAAVFGISEGGPMAITFAATYPQRTLALILYGAYARMVRDADYPWGFPGESSEKDFDVIVDEVQEFLTGVRPGPEPSAAH